MNTLLEVFDYHFRKVKFDARLAHRIYTFERNFVNKNQQHVEFFNGNLLGVVKVVFTPTDYGVWFDEVLEVDDTELTTDIGRLPTVNDKWEVGSDTFYITCVMLCGYFYRSNLSIKVKNDAMRNILMIMQYKMITSNLANYFKYQASREVMEAVKEAMSKKFHIKKLGSWYNVFKNRADDFLFSNESIHKNAIYNSSPDAKIIYVITDTKTRINSIVKNHWELLKEVQEKEKKIVDSTIYFQSEDGMELSDLRRDVSVYRTYIHSIIGIADSFVKEELIEILAKVMPKWSTNLFTKVLTDFSNEYSENHDLQNLINEILTHAFEYMYDKIHLTHNSNIDYPFILQKLKGIYQSSIASDPRLLQIRKEVTDFIVRHNRHTSDALVSSMRTGFLLYIIFRTLTRRHYS